MNTFSTGQRLGWFIVCALLACTLAPVNADANVMSQILCTVVYMITGTVGRALATLAITFVGIAALLGKASWGLALTVVVGIATMMGATTLASMLTGNPGC